MVGPNHIGIDRDVTTMKDCKWNTLGDVEVDSKIAEKHDTMNFGSSNFTHYEQNGFAYEQDRSIIEPILKLDVRECYEDLKDRRTSALTILACKEFGAQKGEILKHATIVDNARDKSSVVIYGSIVFA